FLKRRVISRAPLREINYSSLGWKWAAKARKKKRNPMLTSTCNPCCQLRYSQHHRVGWTHQESRRLCTMGVVIFVKIKKYLQCPKYAPLKTAFVSYMRQASCSDLHRR